jgi:hypothetical protein
MNLTRSIFSIITLFLLCEAIFASKSESENFFFGDNLVSLKDSTKSERDYFFPVLLEDSPEASFSSFISAVLKCDTSVLSRQKGILAVADSIPTFLETSKPRENESGVVTNVLNRFSVSKLIMQPKEIQVLLDSRAFLGKDSPEEHTKALLQLEKKKNVNTVPLPVSSQSKENLYANVKTNEEAEKANLTNRCKQMIKDKANRNDVVIFSEELRAPIFANSQLFSDKFLTKEERMNEYCFRFLIFCSAYPSTYARMSPKVKNMMLMGDWEELYRYGKENLNPEKFRDQLARKQRMFQS